MKTSATILLALATLATPSLAKECSQDQLIAGCYTEQNSRSCRGGGFVLNYPCGAPETAPFRTYSCTIAVRERIMGGGGGWRQVEGPFSLVAKDYDVGVLGLKLSFHRQQPAEVQARIQAMQASCGKYTNNYGCELNCLRQ